jgi:hypothetical protein
MPARALAQDADRFALGNGQLAVDFQHQRISASVRHHISAFITAFTLSRRQVVEVARVHETFV